MKMIHQLTPVLVCILLLQSAVVDAKADEFVEMKFFNHDFRASHSEMHAILHKANLTGHDYKKEVTTKKVQMADGGQEYQEAHYYYKDVNCSKMQDVEEELKRLLPPGVIGKDVEDKFKTEIKTSRIISMGMCKVGLEVHFKKAEGCYDNQKAVSKRKQRGCSWLGIVCISIGNNGDNTGNGNFSNNAVINNKVRCTSSRRRRYQSQSHQSQQSRRHRRRRIFTDPVRRYNEFNPQEQEPC